VAATRLRRGRPAAVPRCRHSCADVVICAATFLTLAVNEVWKVLSGL
jgi:hypothetical protein